MSIEKAPSSSSAHKVGAHAQGVKGKSSDAAQDAGGGGFMAILDSMGDDALDTSASGISANLAALPNQSAATAAALPDLAATAGEAKTQTGKAAMSADQEQLGTATQTAKSEPVADMTAPFDASTMLLQNPQIGLHAAQVLAGASKDVGMKGAGSVQESASHSVKNQVTQSVQQPLTQSPQEPVSRQLMAGFTTGKSTDAQTPSPAVTDATQQGAGSVAPYLLTGGVHANAAKDLAQGAVDSVQSGSGSASATAQQVDKLSVVQDQAKAQQLVTTLAPLVVPLMAKAEKPSSERTALGAKSAEPVYSGTSLGVSTPDYNLPVAQSATLTPDMQVAEQVTYWVTQNVQNAELKLDGLGKSPVEVSIHVQGNEAQIAFRSDEAATRGVLESASAHLKDLLQQEGMVLTGVSVGTSGSSNTGGSQQRQARESARQALVAPLKVASVDAGVRTSPPAGRTVDLFV